MTHTQRRQQTKGEVLDHGATQASNETRIINHGCGTVIHLSPKAPERVPLANILAARCAAVRRL